AWRSRPRSPTYPAPSSPARSPTEWRCAWPCCSSCSVRGATLAVETAVRNEIVIRGGTVVDATGSRRADVGVRDGVVTGVGEGVDVPARARVLDAGGCVVAPGLVDLHSHLRQPGREEAETVESGSRAAALGGYTAVGAMPNTEPAIDPAAVVREVLELGVKALCDVHVAGAI